jgi:phosphocarrier protein
MKSFQHEISNNPGRPENIVGMLVREASKAKSEVILECDGKTGDAKRLFSVKGMNIQNGDNIAVLIEGEDETQTAESLEKFFHENL